MRDDQDIGVSERVGVKGSLGVGGDGEVVLRESLGGTGQRGVGGVLRLHLGGDLVAGRPRLRVGLVEEDGGDLRAAGQIDVQRLRRHGSTLRAIARVVNPHFASLSRYIPSYG